MSHPNRIIAYTPLPPAQIIAGFRLAQLTPPPAKNKKINKRRRASDMFDGNFPVHRVSIRAFYTRAARGKIYTRTRKRNRAK